MKKVLMITYYFPPVVSVGTFRAVKFAKYLPKFGWQPTVLTVKNRDPFGHKFDYQFVKEKLSNAKVFRSCSAPLAVVPKGLRRLGLKPEWFVFLDQFIGWFPHSFLVGRNIIKKEKIDAIYATAPPVTSLLIGAALSWAYRKPLVVDFRDLWIDNPFASYPSEKYYNLEKKIEEWVLRNADAVTVTCESQRKQLMKTFSFLEKSSVSVVHNGYDPDDFEKIVPHKFDKFTILHAGSIYGPRVRTLELFLEATNHLVKNNVVSVEDFQIVFLGYLAREAKKIINEQNLPNVHCLEVKPYDETLRFLMGSDVLLIMPGAEEVLPGKIFEYLATGNFILNLGNLDSEVSQVINQMKVGKNVGDDFSSLKEALHEILRDRVKVTVNSGKLDRFSRVNLTRELASILDSVNAQHVV